MIFEDFQGLTAEQRKKFVIWEQFKQKMFFQGRHIVSSIHMRMEHAVFHPDTTPEQVKKACIMLDEEIKEKV